MHMYTGDCHVHPSVYAVARISRRAYTSSVHKGSNRLCSCIIAFDIVAVSSCFSLNLHYHVCQIHVLRYTHAR